MIKSLPSSREVDILKNQGLVYNQSWLAPPTSSPRVEEVGGASPRDEEVGGASPRDEEVGGRDEEVGGLKDCTKFTYFHRHGIGHQL